MLAMEEDFFEYEYESDEQHPPQEDDDIEMENLFFEADDKKLTEPKKALELFRSVIELEQKVKGDQSYCFRIQALKRVVELSAKLSEDRNELCQDYEQLLRLLSRSACGEVREVLSSVLGSLQSTKPTTAERIYSMTLKYLEQFNLQALWLRVSLQLCSLLLDEGQVERVQGLLPELYQAADEQPASLLKVLALEIEVCRLTADSGKVPDLLQRVDHCSKGAVADAKSLAIISRVKAKVCMSKDAWEEAYTLFFEAFRNYQEAGCKETKLMLEYASLCNMLSLSSINILASHEARSFQYDEQLANTFALRDAFEVKDLRTMKAILEGMSRADESIKPHTQMLLEKTREQALLEIVKPFAVIRLESLADKLNLDLEGTQRLTLKLIILRKMEGKLNLEANTLEMNSSTLDSPYLADELASIQDQWATSLIQAHDSLLPILHENYTLLPLAGLANLIDVNQPCPDISNG